jgi:hypothetical protein
MIKAMKTGRLAENLKTGKINGVFGNFGVKKGGKTRLKGRKIFLKKRRLAELGVKPTGFIRQKSGAIERR